MEGCWEGVGGVGFLEGACWVMQGLVWSVVYMCECDGGGCSGGMGYSNVGKGM